MAVFMQIECADPFEAHALSDVLVSALQAQGISLAPASDRSMGGLNHEFMALGTLPSSDERIRQLAGLAMSMGHEAGGRPVFMEQAHGSIRLTLNEDQNCSLIRAHLRADQDVRLIVR